MCTVTYVPTASGVLLTSNRDEKKGRKPAIPPQKRVGQNYSTAFPVDAEKGGTWFITSENGDTGILLNGARTKHQPLSYYRASRGSILPALFQTTNPINELPHFPLEEIENCTLVLYVDNALYQAIWDGKALTIQELNPQKPHIWSSVTLYDEAMSAQRAAWFEQFLQHVAHPTQEDLLRFHAETEKDNLWYGLKMNRNNEMLTVSITSVAIENHRSVLLYEDCVAQKRYETILPVKLCTSL